MSASSRNRVRVCIVAVGLAFALPACGGGGGGGSVPGSASPGGGGGITATPTPTASPSPSPTPTIAAQSYSGKVVDDSAAPISGGTVQVYTGALYTGTAPQAKARRPLATSGIESATTATDGTFTVAGVPSGTFRVVAFAADSAHTAYHGLATANASASANLKLTHLTTNQIAWIAKINAERQTNGASALVVDEGLTEGTKAFSAYIAANNNTAAYDLCSEAPSGSASGCVDIGTTTDNVQNDPSVGVSINTAGTGPAGTYASADNEFMSESSNCPVQPPTYANCPYSANAPVTGHFLNIIRPTQVFVGVGEFDGGYLGTTPAAANWYAEAFE